jgi:hypothetical protein
MIKTVPMFLNDADLEGRSFTALIREMQTYASVYGHCWAILDKPNSNAKTRAEELNQEIRPYLNTLHLRMLLTGITQEQLLEHTI